MAILIFYGPLNYFNARIFLEPYSVIMVTSGCAISLLCKVIQVLFIYLPNYMDLPHELMVMNGSLQMSGIQILCHMLSSFI
jgi:hypothetical protein